jgi:hypothetical protein
VAKIGRQILETTIGKAREFMFMAESLVKRDEKARHSAAGDVYVRTRTGVRGKTRPHEVGNSHNELSPLREAAVNYWQPLKGNF